MKRLYHILLLALAAASCEIPFSLEDNASPCIYLQCMAGVDSTSIDIRYARPAVGQREQEKEATWTPDFLEVSAGGRPLAIVGGKYYGHLEEGEKISVRAGGEGLKDVTAETVIVPAPKVKGFDVQHLPDSIMKVKISLDREDVPGRHYALQIIREDTWDSFVYTSFLSPVSFINLDEVGSFLSDQSKVQVYMNDGLLSLRQFREDLVTLLEEDSWKDGEYSFYIPMDLNYEQSRYRVVLMRVSDEFYHYARSIYRGGFDFLSNMGMTPANFCWSNVKGGLGCVASFSSWSSEWFGD